jgi:hypothetical protein
MRVFRRCYCSFAKILSDLWVDDIHPAGLEPFLAHIPKSIRHHLHLKMLFLSKFFIGRVVLRSLHVGLPKIIIQS